MSNDPFENLEKNYKPVKLEVLEPMLSDASGGFCLICHTEHYGVEPDARNYSCEADFCNQKSVFGAEEIILMSFAK